MKILRIIARLNVGGPARHVVWLTDGLKPAGHETILVCGVVPPGEDDMSYLAEAAGIHPLIIPEMSRELSLKDAITAWRLFRLMAREQPDIIHTHTAKAGGVGRIAALMYRWLTPGALIAKPRRCRIVHTYHGHVFHSYYGAVKTRIFIAIERLLARATDRIIVVSEQQRCEIHDGFHIGKREQFAVVPLGIDLDVYANWSERRSRLRDELNSASDEVLVGIVGRLTEVKNHQLFLAAAAHLKKIVDTKVRFVIIGDGNLRQQLETQVNELSLKNEVLFLGNRNDPENFYPALDVVALTSLNEGTPLSLIEAMANARPAIGTAIGGVVDLLGKEVKTHEGYQVGERGLLVASGDAVGFAQGLSRLVRDQSLRRELGERGRGFVRQNHGKERLLRDIANLYRELDFVPAHSTAQHQRAATDR